MPLSKPKKNLKIACLIPCYKRPEYTQKCVQSVSDAINGLQVNLFLPEKDSLRTAIIDFFNETKDQYDFLVKIDNDCMVPEDYFNKMLDIFESSDVEILSPNVCPSNAAYRFGDVVEGLPYMPSKIVGGLWMMRSKVIDGIKFSKYDVHGLTGAFPILKQIIVEKEPIVGWAKDIVVQDIGHWSGEHPEHIKSKEHQEYSLEVGRRIAWTA